MTLDFQTLYTKIPDNNVLKVLCDLIDFCFEGGVIIHVTVTKYGASEFQEAFRKSVKFLLDNCFCFFFKFRTRRYQHIIGFYMGFDSAPFKAKLFFY